MKYKHLFFDLDHTLWDFDANAKETLVELYDIFQLQAKGVVPFEDFYKLYKIHNEILWDRYHKGFVTGEELKWKRMYRTLLEKMINVNLYSAYHLTRTLLPDMMTAMSGHIFNICSIASLQAYSNGGSYSISKFAMMGFSKNLREELKSFNIKVTAVYPGAVLTDSWGDYDNSENRIMVANDVAAMVVNAAKLSPSAVVEDIIMRPQLGDL